MYLLLFIPVLYFSIKIFNKHKIEESILYLIYINIIYLILLSPFYFFDKYFDKIGTDFKLVFLLGVSIIIYTSFVQPFKILKDQSLKDIIEEKNLKIKSDKYSKSLDKINIYTELNSYFFSIISCLIIFYYVIFENNKNDDPTTLFTIFILFICFAVLLYVLSTLFYIYAKILNFNINFIYSKFVEKLIFNALEYVSSSDISDINLKFLKSLKVLNIYRDSLYLLYKSKNENIYIYRVYIKDLNMPNTKVKDILFLNYNPIEKINISLNDIQVSKLDDKKDIEESDYFLISDIIDLDFSNINQLEDFFNLKSIINY